MEEQRECGGGPGRRAKHSSNPGVPQPGCQLPKQVLQVLPCPRQPCCLSEPSELEAPVGSGGR